MASEDLKQLQLRQPTYSLVELLVQLFTLGIFSVHGGAKAWFELVIVSATLCISGYLLWWQIPLLILAILLATLATGMFAVLAPQYLEMPNFGAEEMIAATLQFISEENLNQIATLSGDELEKRLKDFYKAKRIFENDLGIMALLGFS